MLPLNGSRKKKKLPKHNNKRTSEAEITAVAALAALNTETRLHDDESPSRETTTGNTPSPTTGNTWLDAANEEVDVPPSSSPVSSPDFSSVSTVPLPLPNERPERRRQPRKDEAEMAQSFQLILPYLQQLRSINEGIIFGNVRSTDNELQKVFFVLPTSTSHFTIPDLW